MVTCYQIWALIFLITCSCIRATNCCNITVCVVREIHVISSYLWVRAWYLLGVWLLKISFCSCPYNFMKAHQLFILWCHKSSLWIRPIRPLKQSYGEKVLHILWWKLYILNSWVNAMIKRIKDIHLGILSILKEGFFHEMLSVSAKKVRML